MKIELESENSNLNKTDIKYLLGLINKKMVKLPEYYLNKFDKIIIKYNEKELVLENCYLYDNHEVVGYKQKDLILIKSDESYYHLRVDEILEIKLNKRIIEFKIKSKTSLIIK